jgi:hypothetical protein
MYLKLIEISDYKQTDLEDRGGSHSYVGKRISITGSMWPPSGWSRWPLNVKFLQTIRIPSPS